MYLKRFFLLLLLLCFIVSTNAQKLTGTWEGVINESDFIQINILQSGDTLCGFTYDYISPESYCTANFTALYNKKRKLWYTESTSFIENKGGHVLMQMQFKVAEKKGKPYIKGFVYGLSPISGKSTIEEKLSANKIAAAPSAITQYMKDCAGDKSMQNN